MTSWHPNRTSRRRLVRSAGAKARTAESADAKTNAGGGAVAVEFRGLHRIIRPTRAFVLLAAAVSERVLVIYSAMLVRTDDAKVHHRRRYSMPQLRRPKPDRRRAFELLAASHDGATEAPMIAHAEQLVELINAGLATTSVDRNRSR